MASPSKASHGCFGAVGRFSVGKFVGYASELLNDAKWNTVTKRNQKGKHKTREISNLKNWNAIPEEMINLMVAPKVNDHHGQEVHNKTMQKKRNAMKPQKTQKVQIIKPADLENPLKEIKKTDELLIKESNLIEEELKQAELSTK